MNNKKNIFIVTTKRSGTNLLGQLFDSMQNYCFNGEVWSLNNNPGFQEVGRIQTIYNIIKNNNLHNVFVIYIPQFFLKDCDVTIKDLDEKIYNSYFIVLNRYDKLSQYVSETLNRKKNIHQKEQINFKTKNYYKWLENNLSFYRYIFNGFKDINYFNIDYTYGYSDLELSCLSDFLEIDNNFDSDLIDVNKYLSKNVLNYIDDVDIAKNIPFNKRFISSNEIISNM